MGEEETTVEVALWLNLNVIKKKNKISNKFKAFSEVINQ